MSESKHYADKSLGQHFLKDKKVISSICSDHADKVKYAMEVGPGPGALTKELKELPLEFAVVEKDARFEPHLKEWLGEKNVYLQDALEVDLAQIYRERGWDNVWLVSNLPYNVSVPLFLKFTQEMKIQYMTLMFQREVALKIFDFTQSKNPMSSLMAIAQTYFQVRLLCQAPPGAFHPPPKVDSTVLSFVRIDQPVISLEDLPRFEKFLRTLYQFKRKQAHKNLKTSFTPAQIEAAFQKLGLNPQARAETFQLDQIHLLYKELH